MPPPCRRLAVCNMDWDKLRAVDLFALANSFKPPTGVIQRVSIFVSDYGKERIEREEREGPGNLIREQLKDQRPKVKVRPGCAPLVVWMGMDVASLLWSVFSRSVSLSLSLSPSLPRPSPLSHHRPLSMV